MISPRSFKKALSLILLFAFVGALATPAMGAMGKTYKMAGKIVAIDLDANTVVVDVPIEKNKVYRVAGPLADDAVLKKGMQKGVSLKDFQVGEKVTVEWKVTEKGHLVKMLSAK
ncbi:MAG: hypothetical protein DSY91_03170 [Deltaproteobacteria bacterium]|nr:MAG: hypothetical protein DSY91_03170 [Deltaproteobacteria bacterium]